MEIKTYLICKHCIGKNCTTYTLKCKVLKTMPDLIRVKILVFGTRFNKKTDTIGRVRYVNVSRIATVCE